MGKNDDDRPQNVMMTADQLKQLIESMRGPAAPTPGISNLTPDDQIQLLLKQVKEGQNREVHKIERFKCTSLETEASFTAVVATSKTFPEGRVVALDGYTYPPGSDAHIEDGGLVPNGLVIRMKDNLTPTREWKQWRWLFWQADLKRFIGKDAMWLRRLATTETAPAP